MEPKSLFRTALIVALWYLGMTLGVPALNGAVALSPGRFAEHAVSALVVTSLVVCGVGLASLLFRSPFKSRRKRGCA